VFRPIVGQSMPLAAVAFGVGIPMAIGFAGTMAVLISQRLERAAAAMRALAGGDLGAHLEEEGKDELGVVARTFNQMVTSLREKAFVERAFGRYVAPGVLASLRARNALEIPVERRDATVLYADVRGFTSWSEQENPEEVMRVLNLYFARVVQVVERHEGYVNKFIGDAVMVIFNALSEQPDHAARALACARQLQTEVAAMNAAHAFGANRALEIGIGVNTGPLVAGSLGSEGRAEYTVIGDTVNVAARLTSNARAGEILVGSNTARGAPAEKLEAVPPLTVKGKAAPLEVFRLPC
jgi:adenylate cyclase